MKKILALLCAVAFVFSMAATASAIPITNGGFETGDFTGWSVYVPPGASAEVVTSYTTSDPGGVVTYDPMEGSYFAKLKTDGHASYTTLRQTINLTSNSSVHGWAAFEDNDFGGMYNDLAAVTIYDTIGTLLAVPWYQSSNLVNGVGVYGQTPWQYWTWTPPDSGDYVVELAIANVGSQINDSFALFDGVRASPEPATLLLVGSGFLGFAGIGRKRFIKRQHNT